MQLAEELEVKKRIRFQKYMAQHGFLKSLNSIQKQESDLFPKNIL